MARRAALLRLFTHPWWWALGAVSAVVLLVQLPASHATAWHFFELAADLLVGDGPDGDGQGLALYRDHPELQFGPLSILVALPLTLLGGAGEIVVLILGSAVGLILVRMSFDTYGELRPLVAAAVGVVIVVAWGDVVVRTAHIDDAITLLAVAAAVRAIAQDRGRASKIATVMLAVAAAAKPWGVIFAPLAAAPAGPWRWLRPIVAAGVGVLTWAPFVLAAPDTLDTSEFGIRTDPTSVLRAFGVDAATTPTWVRPTQLVGGMVLVAVLVAARRWPAAFLAGVAWRLLLDPGAHRYYTIGFVLGALLVELGSRRDRIPWFTITAALALEVTAMPDVPTGPALALRAVTVMVALFVVILPQTKLMWISTSDVRKRPQFQD